MKIACIGAGSWGTCVAAMLTSNGHQVMLWARSPDIANEINDARTNATYLPGISLPAELRASSDPEDVLSGAELIVVGVPSHALRATLHDLAPALGGARSRPIISLVKGIEIDSFLRMSQVIADTWEVPIDKVAALSGPNHAEEVAREIPSASVIAGSDPVLIRSLQDVFMNKMFRVYTNSDLVGVEFSGAIKNVIAIAAGISDGLGYGDNTKATLLTRGLAEIARLGASLGASPQTFAGLASIGDLIATCTSPHSRNRRLGEMIGKGHTLAEVTAGTRMIAEGVMTSRAVVDLAATRGVELPISREVAAVLHQGKDPRASVNSLMTRDPTAELSDA